MEGDDRGVVVAFGGLDRVLAAVHQVRGGEDARAVFADLLQHLIDGGLKPVAIKMVHLSEAQAKGFYHVHRERGFFGDLVKFMTSGPCIVQVLEGENAIVRYRDIMGATDPGKAAAGTIRKVHAKSIGENSVHGSDAPDTAMKEIAQFFSGNDIVG